LLDRGSPLKKGVPFTKSSLQVGWKSLAAFTVSLFPSRISRDISTFQLYEDLLRAATARMFFLRYLTREMTMSPSLFARDMTQILKEQLYQQMEGDCNGEFYTICILDVTDISKGRVLPGTAEAMFTLSYRAIVWKPFRGETVRFQSLNDNYSLSEPPCANDATRQLDCMVTKVNRAGVFCEAGPLTIFVAQTVQP
jgi:DNA-directed RNA polymerase II subunit RPB7